MSGKFMMNGIEYLGGGSGGGGGNVDDVYVNGESVLDENKIAQVTSYKEVTLAEYTALPDTKLNDGVMYCIKDVGGANQFPPLIYSDEEREVGIWRDGKTLYEKTVHTGAIRTSNVSVAHNVANIENVVDIYGYCKIDAGSFIPLPFVQGNSGATNYQVRVDVSTTNVVLSSVSLTDGADSYVTFRYTKTTDTPGSGTWTTQGGYAHHYSTTEHIIGTWIDGKPLYEKVLTNISLSRNTWVDVLTNISDYYIVGGTVLRDGEPIPFGAFNAGIISTAVLRNSVLKIQIVSNNSETYSINRLIVRYTKTTD